MRLIISTAVSMVLVSNLPASGAFNGDPPDAHHPWAVHDMNRPQPTRVEPGTFSSQATPGKPPSDAIVLFGGVEADLSKWQSAKNPAEATKWIVQDGALLCVPKSGYIRTKEEFGDCQLHLEWAAPAKIEGSGQGRGNSGIYLMGRYEVQILDSYDNQTYFDGQCGAIYKEQPPSVNVSRKPGEWQSFDILFTAPRFHEDGTLLKPGFVTVLHNGVLVHNHFELLGITSYVEPAKYSKHNEKEPLLIQFHGNPVRFRNIWIRENIKPLIGLNPDPRPNSVQEKNSFDRFDR